MHQAMIAPRPRRAKSAAKALVVKPNPELAFHAAYLKLRTKLPTIDKDENIVTKGGVKIAYASMPAIRRTTDPFLEESQMYMIHQGVVLDSGLYIVRSFLRHVDGGFMVSECAPPTKPIPGSATSESQALQGALTTGMRHNTRALLNLNTEAPQDLGHTPQVEKIVNEKQYEDMVNAMADNKVPEELIVEHYVKKYCGGDDIVLLNQLPVRFYRQFMNACKNWGETRKAEEAWGR